MTMCLVYKSIINILIFNMRKSSFGKLAPTDAINISQTEALYFNTSLMKAGEHKLKTAL